MCLLEISGGYRLLVLMLLFRLWGLAFLDFLALCVFRMGDLAGGLGGASQSSLFLCDLNK